MAMAASTVRGAPPGLDLGRPADASASYNDSGSAGMFHMDEAFLAPPAPTQEEIAAQKKEEADAAFQARQAAWESQVRRHLSKMRPFMEAMLTLRTPEWIGTGMGR